MRRPIPRSVPKDNPQRHSLLRGQGRGLITRKLTLKELRFTIRHRLFVLDRKWHCHPLFHHFYPQKAIYRRFLVVILALLILFPAFLFYFHPSQTSAAWWDASYAYRQQITFNHNAALTNASMQLTISTTALVSNGKMQIDCDDSRFTDSNGKLLRYHYVSGCNSGSTV